ncbi:MAG: 50S ribosomal protein L21 [Candidatus Latescibacterota bacterium]|nr:MAG: 50S ribosomal protein L21 [Candidatus Latescibacterota bacterium]
MYAVVRIGGMQYRVSPQERVRVPKLQVEEGQALELKEVLLVGRDDGVLVGTPLVPRASVRARVLEHGKGKKVIVFKMKRRKKYRRKRGHRQPYTELLIEDIVLEPEEVAEDGT